MRKINWKVRIKNPYFWLAIGGVVLTAMGVSPEMFTSWQAVWEAAANLVSNPFMLGSVVIAVIGVINDPTTAGVADSAKALEYKRPKGRS